MEENLFIFQIFICIMTEAIIMAFREIANEIKIILYFGSVPTLLLTLYNMRYLLHGIEGLQEYLQNPHTSFIIILVAIFVANINIMTLHILENKKIS